MRTQSKTGKILKAQEFKGEQVMTDFRFVITDQSKAKMMQPGSLLNSIEKYSHVEVSALFLPCAIGPLFPRV